MTTGEKCLINLKLMEFWFSIQSINDQWSNAPGFSVNIWRYIVDDALVFHLFYFDDFNKKFALDPW